MPVTSVVVNPVMVVPGKSSTPMSPVINGGVGLAVLEIPWDDKIAKEAAVPRGTGAWVAPADPAEIPPTKSAIAETTPTANSAENQQRRRPALVK